MDRQPAVGTLCAVDKQPDNLAARNRLAGPYMPADMLAADKPVVRRLAADHMAVRIAEDSRFDKELDIPLADKRADIQPVEADNNLADTDIQLVDMDKDNQAAPHMVPEEALVAACFLTQVHH